MGLFTKKPKNRTLAFQGEPQPMAIPCPQPVPQYQNATPAPNVSYQSAPVAGTTPPQTPPVRRSLKYDWNAQPRINPRIVENQFYVNYEGTPYEGKIIRKRISFTPGRPETDYSKLSTLDKMLYDAYEPFVEKGFSSIYQDAVGDSKELNRVIARYISLSNPYLMYFKNIVIDGKQYHTLSECSCIDGIGSINNYMCLFTNRFDMVEYCMSNTNFHMQEEDEFYQYTKYVKNRRLRDIMKDLEEHGPFDKMDGILINGWYPVYLCGNVKLLGSTGSIYDPYLISYYGDPFYPITHEPIKDTEKDRALQTIKESLFRQLKEFHYIDENNKFI